MRFAVTRDMAATARGLTWHTRFTRSRMAGARPRLRLRFDLAISAIRDVIEGNKTTWNERSTKHWRRPIGAAREEYIRPAWPKAYRRWTTPRNYQYLTAMESMPVTAPIPFTCPYKGKGELESRSSQAFWRSIFASVGE